MYQVRERRRCGLQHSSSELRRGGETSHCAGFQKQLKSILQRNLLIFHVNGGSVKI
jgi:hypothetical protein